jgi:hypothetical protein
MKSDKQHFLTGLLARNNFRLARPGNSHSVGKCHRVRLLNSSPPSIDGNLAV